MTEHHCHQPEIAFFLEVCFDRCKAASCGLADGFDEQALTDTQFNTNIIWA
jgi:hypothetical protein